MGRYFGTDGFRGEANKTLTNEHAYKIGRFLGWYFIQKEKTSKIVIGKDTRRSSYMLEYALATGIAASGGEAYLMHVTTTPSVAYTTRMEDFDCGVMISASHNSFEDNGIKLFNSNGEKVSQSLLDKIECYIDGDMSFFDCTQKDIPLAYADKIGIINDYLVGRNRYMAYLLSIAVHSYRGMRVGLDTANGASYAIARNVFESLGAKVYIINNQPNGININVNCGSTHIESLQKLVVENKLDIGFAFDGDADRCLCVDEYGNVLSGDATLYLCAKYMKSKNLLPSNTVVTTVMSNIGLYKAFDEIGIFYSKVNVGDKYVYEDLIKNNRELGGEDSGHTIFKKYATTGDGILTAMMIMEVLLDSKSTIHSLTKSLVVYPQTLINVKVKNKKTVLKDKDVINQIEKVKQELGENGRVLVRESGTEPLIRVMVEAVEKETCDKLANSIVLVIKQKQN